MRQWIERHSLELELFLTIWLVYAVYVTPAGGVTPNRYVDLVHSIVNERRFAIDTYQENTIDKAYYDGHYYAGALPGPAFLAVPAYVVFKGIYVLIPQPFKELAGGIESYKKQNQPSSGFYGRVDNVEYFFSELFLTLAVLATTSAFGAVMLFKSVEVFGYSTKIALLVTTFYAFGTIVFFYSTVFFEQVFSATLAITAFYVILRISRITNTVASWRLALLAGFLSGCGVIVEYPAVFVVIWLGLWLFLAKRGWKPVLFYAGGSMFAVVVHLAYSYALFGNPFTTPYAHLTSQFDTVHGIGFFGATYPHLDRFLALLLGSERGLFLFVPISLIGLVGLVYKIWKKGPEFAAASVCMGIVASYVIFFSAYTNWRGGAAFGPRYLVATLPFLAIGIGFASDFLPRVLIYVIGLLSIFINWAGAQFGFADSPLQHIQDVLIHGPSMPTIGAILTHSTSHESPLYLFAERYHIGITLIVTIGLIGVFILIFRDIFRQQEFRREAELEMSLPREH